MGPAPIVVDGEHVDGALLDEIELERALYPRALRVDAIHVAPDGALADPDTVGFRPHRRVEAIEPADVVEAPALRDVGETVSLLASDSLDSGKDIREIVHVGIHAAADPHELARRVDDSPGS